LTFPTFVRIDDASPTLPTEQRRTRSEELHYSFVTFFLLISAELLARDGCRTRVILRALRATPWAKITTATRWTVAGFTGLWPLGCKGESLALRAALRARR
jgi:hypothetical protein